MPALANIVINDGASTPVAHTFAPSYRDASTGVFWFEQITPVPSNPLAAKRIGYKQTRGGSTDKNGALTSSSKASYTLHVPTLETLGTNDNGITPPPTLAYKEIARCEFELPERGAKQERKDTRVLMQNFLAAAMAISNIDDLQASY